MRALLIAVFTFALSACAQQPAVNVNALEAAANDAIDVYLSCMDTAAKVYATTSISATEASIAAQGHCSAELTKFDLAIHSFMAGSVKTAKGQVFAAERADILVADIKRKAQESVVAKVVEHRMLQNTPTPSKDAPKQKPNTGI